MSRSYDLNPESAKQANMNNRITETGKYVGKFTRAESIFSKQNTEGIEFTFESNDGQSADFLTLWTINSDGKEIFGMKVLNSLMTCLRIKSISPKEMLIEKFDNGAKKKINAMVYPELMNTPIGLLLQREEYEKSDKSISYKFNIYACFDPKTEMMAGEILDRATKAEQLAKVLSTLRDKPMQKRTDKTSGYSAPHTNNGGGAVGGFDDDIPFDSYGKGSVV